MLKKRIISALVVIALGSLILALYLNDGSLIPKEKYTATLVDLFDTKTEIIGYAKSESEFNDQASIIADKLAYYDKLFDIYNDYEGINNIKTINDNAGLAPVVVDEEVINLIKLGYDMYYETDGNVNIAMGSVLKLWHEYRQAGLDNPSQAALPSIEELEEANAHTYIEAIIINEENSTVYLSDPEMSLDVGSIAKGYAVEHTLEYAKSQGLDDILISAGGNIDSLGARADGTAFKVGIQNPDLSSDESYVAIVYIRYGKSVVSSGDYQRFYTVDGVDYCHIINPYTLFPSTDFSQVTVIYDDSGMADAYSTALFNMSLNEGMLTVESIDGMEAMWIDKKGNAAYSSGFEEFLVDEDEEE